MGVAEISRLRFDIFAAYARGPGSFLAEEIEYYALDQDRVLGILFRDRVDKDFSGLVFGPDARRRYRCVDVRPFTDSVEIARADLKVSIEQWGLRPASDFHQGDERGNPLDVFLPIAPSAQLNPGFIGVASHENFVAARFVIERMMPFFEDVDGTFINQFQTSAFDSRIWELYLFAALTELGCSFDRSFHAPDFKCISFQQNFFVEATTINPRIINGVIAEPKPKDMTPAALKTYFTEYLPIKWGSALYSKLEKKYWELPHVGDEPIIFAVQDFHAPQSMTYTSGTLAPYLYGLAFTALYDSEGKLHVTSHNRGNHTWEGKTISSGFFNQPNAEHVSAVLANPLGTVSKFNRIGIGAGFGSSDVATVMTGVRHVHDPNASEPKPFALRVREGYSEPWAGGMHVFHNPNALHPIDPEVFSSVAQSFLENGRLVAHLPEFHPYSSTTQSFVPDRLGSGMR